MKLYEIFDGNKQDKMFACIYLWTNLVNGKHYVGQTQNFYNRMVQYNRGHTNRHLTHAIDKYGIDNFEIEVIEYIDDIAKLDEREQYWIDYYQSYQNDKGYNICQYASTTRGFRHSDETKQRLSEIRKENPTIGKGEEHPMFGKHHTEEWKEDHSKWLKEKWATDEQYRQYWHDKMAGQNNYFYDVHMIGELNPMYGRHHTEEAKRKISESKKGKYYGKSTKVICVETGEIFDSICKCAKYFNSDVSGVYVVLDKPNRTCKGYHFKRVV